MLKLYILCNYSGPACVDVHLPPSSASEKNRELKAHGLRNKRGKTPQIEMLN